MARKRRTVAGPDDPRRLTDQRNIPIEAVQGKQEHAKKTSCGA